MSFAVGGLRSALKFGALVVFPLLFVCASPVQTREKHLLRRFPVTRAHAGAPTQQIGIASWYGERDRGKATASGIRFDPEMHVAAHKTLPLPSIVRVTNMTNGKYLDVFVIDRLPSKWNRAIDLSHGAAKRLGFLKTGLARVKIEVISYPSLRFVKATLRRSKTSSSPKRSTSRKI